MAKKKRTTPKSSKDNFEYEYDPVKREVGGVEAEKVIWSTKSLDAAVQALNEGLPLKVNPFCGKDTQLLKPELLYKRTKEEVEDYIKCMQDPVYFASKCFLMTPAGLQACTLRDYQVDYLNLVAHNRFTIFRSCRQSGKCLRVNQLGDFKIKNKIKTLSFLELFEIFGFDKQLFDNLSKQDNYSEKIIKSKDISNENIQILTDTGYKNISHIHITRPFENWIVKLENGYELEGADKHILFREDYSEVFIDELEIGDKILTDKGPSKVIYIENTKVKLCMADISVDDENHRFYSNGILSHNSTTTAIYALWVVLFHNDKNALILSKSAAASSDLLEKIKTMYRFLPYYLKLGTMKWNQGSISFDNNSQLAHEAFSPTAGLGKTINMLILDEFAWTPQNDAKLFYMNIIPTVTTIPDSNVCIMSTQNGHNLFYEIFTAAEKKKNIYVPFTVDWWQVPNFNTETQQWEKRTEAWKEMMVGVLGSEEAFQYQYGTQFSASDKCLVSRECIGKMRDTTVLFENREDFSEKYTLRYPECMTWDPNFNSEELNTGYFFCLIDLAEGGGGDFTVFNIFQVKEENKYVQVGTWTSNKIDLEHVALEFWLLGCQLFNNERCLTSIEWNTYGALFYRIVMDLNDADYDEENSWRFNINGIDPDGFDQTRIVNYKKGSMEENILGVVKSTSKFVPGIRFSSGNKSAACSLLKMLLEKGNVDLISLTTVSELENFEDKNGSGTYKASYGHDDQICTCLQIPMMQQTPIWKDFIEEFNLNNLNEGRQNKWGSDTNSLYGDAFNVMPSDMPNSWLSNRMF